MVGEGNSSGRAAAWGKLSDDRMRWHSLSAHCVDVGLMFGAMLEASSLRRRLSGLIGREATQVDVARLCVVAALHDAGKASNAFQAVGDPASDPYDRGGHVDEMLHAWDDPHGFGLRARAEDALGLPAMREWFEAGPAAVVEVSLFRHHGEPDGLRSSRSPNGGGWQEYAGDPFAAISAMRHAVFDAFPEAFRDGPPVRTNGPVLDLFAGLVAEADALASRHLPLVDGADLADARAYVDTTMRRVREVWARRVPRRAPVATVSPFDHPRRTLVGSSVVDPLEMALARARELVASGEVDGLLHVVPGPRRSAEVAPRLDEVWRGTPPSTRGAGRGGRGTFVVRTVDDLARPRREGRHEARAAAMASRLLLVVEAVDCLRGRHLADVASVLDAHAALGGHSLVLGSGLTSEQVRALAPQATERDGVVADAGGGPDLPGRIEARVVTGSGSAATAAALEAASASRSAGRTVLVVRNDASLAIRTSDRCGGRVGALADGVLLCGVLPPEGARDVAAALARARTEAGWDRPRVIVAGPAVEDAPPLGVDHLVTDLCPPDVMARRLAHLAANGGVVPTVTVVAPEVVDMRADRCGHLGFGTGRPDDVFEGAVRLVEAVGRDGTIEVDVTEWLDAARVEHLAEAAPSLSR